MMIGIQLGNQRELESNKRSTRDSVVEEEPKEALELADLATKGELVFEV
jgi:hypothetical protein